MDDQMGSDTPKKGRWQHRLHTWARQSLVREVWEWVRCKDVTLPNVRQLAESIAELPTSAVDGVVHGSEVVLEKRRSASPSTQNSRPQNSRITPRESAKCPIGQTARPEAAVRNWISAGRAASSRPFDRVQNGLRQNSPCWQIMVR